MADSEAKKLLKKELKKLVKKANQRLRELENQGMTRGSNAYQYVKRKTYDEDKAYGKTLKGQIKFRTNVGSMTYNELKHLKKEVYNFLKAKTSTKSGIKGVYEKSKSAFEAKTGIHVSDELYSEFYRDKLIQTAIGLYGSEQMNNLLKKTSQMEMNTEQVVAQLEALGLNEDSEETDVEFEKIEETFDNLFVDYLVKFTGGSYDDGNTDMFGDSDWLNYPDDDEDE
ncbi:MAG: hypothetical protein KBT03_00525 [Bacteroidales bacterium]|nr:hypothetical protein [Candidatus Scybalousia scybalohippi]